MKEIYTSSEARAALHVDAKTFLRWLEQADMQPQVSKADHRIKIFTHEQIERLADEHERDLRASEYTLSTDERIDALESRLSIVEGLLAGMGSQPPTRRLTAPRAPYAASRPSENDPLPDGLVPINDLIKEYHLPRSTVIHNMRDYLKEGNWKAGGSVIQHALDAEGVAEFMRRYEKLV